LLEEKYITDIPHNQISPQYKIRKPKTNINNLSTEAKKSNRIDINKKEEKLN
jgi:hypothetical protein